MSRKRPGQLGKELLGAASKGDVGKIQEILAAGAQVDYQCKDMDRLNSTALTLAAQFGREAAVVLLLERGAAVNHRNYWGKSPLIGAAKSGHSSVIERLMYAGADNSLADINKKTAQDYASQIKDEVKRKSVLLALETLPRPPPKIGTRRFATNAFGSSPRTRPDVATGMRRARLQAERRTKPLDQWSVGAVVDWLRMGAAAGVPVLPVSTIEAFEDEEIDGATLATMVQVCVNLNLPYTPREGE